MEIERADSATGCSDQGNYNVFQVISWLKRASLAAKSSGQVRFYPGQYD